MPGPSGAASACWPTTRGKVAGWAQWSSQCTREPRTSLILPATHPTDNSFNNETLLTVPLTLLFHCGSDTATYDLKYDHGASEEDVPTGDIRLEPAYPQVPAGNGGGYDLNATR